MTNFNEKINSHKEFFLSADGCDYFIERVGSMCQLEREFDYRLKVLSLKVLKGVCRLFIQYKDACRVQKWQVVVSCGLTLQIRYAATTFVNYA